MLFEAVIGCGSLDICRLWLTSYWLAGPVTADPRGVAEERPALPKAGVPPCFQVETERGEVGVVAIQSGKHQVRHRRPHSCGMDSSLHEYKLRQR